MLRILLLHLGIVGSRLYCRRYMRVLIEASSGDVFDMTTAVASELQVSGRKLLTQQVRTFFLGVYFVYGTNVERNHFLEELFATLLGIFFEFSNMTVSRTSLIMSSFIAALSHLRYRPLSFPA